MLTELFSVPSPYLFLLIFISLLFLRPSKTYDFEAFFAIAFGTFIAFAFQASTHPTVHALIQAFYRWNSPFLIARLIFLFVGIRQFTQKSFFYPEVLDNIIESPYGLLLLSLLLALDMPIYLPLSAPLNFKMILIKDIVLWTIGGSIVVTIKNTIPEKLIRTLFGITAILLSIMMFLPFPIFQFGL